MNDCLQGFFERELKKSDIVAHEPTGVEESPAPRDIVDLEVRCDSVVYSVRLLLKFHKHYSPLLLIVNSAVDSTGQSRACVMQVTVNNNDVGFNCFGLFYLLLSFLAPAECGRFQ